MVLWSFGPCVPATVFPSCVCGMAALVSTKVFWLVMGSDGFQTQKKKSWVSGQVWAERILAETITIDCRKASTYTCCSESNVWTRWLSRRCYNNIPAGLLGKKRQAIAAKSGEWSAGSSASSGEEDRKARAMEAEKGLMPWKRKEECKEGRGIRKKYGEIVWKSRMRPSAAENWMNRGKSCRRSYERSIKCPFVSKEMQDSLKESLQHQLQEVERRRNDLMPEHEKVQKRTQQIQSLQDKRRNVQKEGMAAKEEMWKIREGKLMGKKSA